MRRCGAFCTTPTPNPSPQGGGDRRRECGERVGDEPLLHPRIARTPFGEPEGSRRAKRLPDARPRRHAPRHEVGAGHRQDRARARLHHLAEDGPGLVRHERARLAGEEAQHALQQRGAVVGDQRRHVRGVEAGAPVQLRQHVGIGREFGVLGLGQA